MFGRPKKPPREEPAEVLSDVSSQINQEDDTFYVPPSEITTKPINDALNNKVNPAMTPLPPVTPMTANKPVSSYESQKKELEEKLAKLEAEEEQARIEAEKALAKNIPSGDYEDILNTMEMLKQRIINIESILFRVVK